MPRRSDLESVLIIGSGPIVIGQACEFDYSGTQACKALREEGLRVVLINSNPATIMTDPELADATYVEPLTVEVLDKVLAREKVKAILPTLAGQPGPNLGMAAYKAGELDRMVQFALDQSPVHQVLIEQSVLGWKEFELEVVRDTKDNAIII